MFFEVILKVLETASQRRSSTGSESTKRATGPHVLNLFFEDIQIFFATPPRFEIPEYCIHPRQPVATGRTETTGLMGEKLHEITDHSDRAGLIVKHDHGTGSQSAPPFLGDFIVIECEVEVLRQHKVGRATTG